MSLIAEGDRVGHAWGQTCSPRDIMGMGWRSPLASSSTNIQWTALETHVLCSRCVFVCWGVAESIRRSLKRRIGPSKGVTDTTQYLPMPLNCSVFYLTATTPWNCNFTTPASFFGHHHHPLLQCFSWPFNILLTMRLGGNMTRYVSMGALRWMSCRSQGIIIISSSGQPASSGRWRRRFQWW